MKKMVMSATVIVLCVAGAVAWSQSAVTVTSKTIYITPLEGDPSRIVRLRDVSFPAGADSGFHRHPGDQWNTIDEGEVVFTIEGQPPRTMKAGETSIIPRGVVHRNQNLSGKPVRIIELNIIDKDKPDFDPVKE